MEIAWYNVMAVVEQWSRIGDSAQMWLILVDVGTMFANDGEFRPNFGEYRRPLVEFGQPLAIVCQIWANLAEVGQHVAEFGPRLRLGETFG